MTKTITLFIKNIKAIIRKQLKTNYPNWKKTYQKDKISEIQNAKTL